MTAAPLLAVCGCGHLRRRKTRCPVPTVLGEVTEVWRYPVKSLLGELLVTPTVVTADGIEGDRGVAWVDVETGATASAKRPVRWAPLLQLHAETTDGVTFVRFPDGSRLALTDHRLVERVSALVGRPVRLTNERRGGDFLERADPEQVVEQGLTSDVSFESGPVGRAVPGASFHDFAPLHLLTTGSIERISQHLAAPALESQRYRPNLVIRTPAEIHPEVEWPGSEIVLGSVRLRIIAPTPRCAIPTLSHGGLPPRPAAFSAVREHRRVPVLDLGDLPCLGVYASVVSPGEVRPGDLVLLADE